MSAHLTSKRRGLRIGTALATGIIGIMQVPAAQAQTLPSIGTGNDGGAVITTIQTVNPGDTRQVDVNGASRDINWQTYSIGADGFVNYVNTGAAGNYVALNRVTGGNLSQIDGTINAPSSITVWLINPSGIMFSDGSTFSGGSLVLSTLPPANAGEIADILAGGTSVTLGNSTGNANAASDYPGVITVSSGSTINSSGRVEMISQQITMNGSIDADGDVGLVLGHEVTIDATAASPLRYTVGAGARLAASRLRVGGSINGANVELLAISRDAVTGALLQVDDTATITAEAVNGSIYLHSEATATNNSEDMTVGGDLIASNASNTTGKIGIFADNDVTLDGNISIDDAGDLTVDADNITIGGSAAQTFDIGGDATFTAVQNGNILAGSGLTLTTGGAISFVADGNTTISSALSAGGSLGVSGDVVVLGNGTDTRLQQAAGAITVAASAGNLTVGAGTTLQSTGSTITLTALDNGADVIVNGRIDADGDLTVTANDDIQIASASGANGYLISQTGAATLTATGGSIFRSGGAGDTLTSLSGIYGYDSDGDITITADGDLHLSQITAGGAVSVTIDNGQPSVSGALLGAPTSGSLTVQGGVVQAAGVVTLTTGGANERVVLKEVSGDDVQVTAEDLFVEHLSITGAGNYTQTSTNQFIGLLSQVASITTSLTGQVPAVSNVVATSADGAFSSSYGKTLVTADLGTVNITTEKGAQLSAVTAGGAVTILAGGVLADSIESGATIDVTATDGTLAIGTATSAGDLTLTKNNGSTGTDGDELRLGTGTVTTGGAALDSDTSVRVGSLQANGAVTVVALAGDVSGLLTGTSGALSLISTAAVLDADYGSANLTSDTSLVDVTALNGGVQLGDVTADTDFSVFSKAISLNNAGVGGVADLAATEGTLVLASLTAGQQAIANKSGGSIANAGDELRITNSFAGGTSGVSTGTQALSSTHVRGGTIRDYISTVEVDATTGDVVIANQVLAMGGITIDAGRDVLIASFNSTTNNGRILSQTGGIDITAARSVYGIGGSDSALPVTPGVGSDYVVSGNVLVQGTGDLLVGSITASGAITFDLTGGIYGTTGSSGSDVPGGALFAANDINVTALGASGVNVLKSVNSTAGVANLSGDQIAIGSPDASGTFYFDEAGNPYNLALPADAAKVYVGVISIAGDYILTPNNPLTHTNLIATEDTSGLPAYGPEKFDALLGKTNLDAGGSITGTITGAAQLGTVISGDASNLTVGALVADSFTVGVDGLDITATTGTLSILDANVSGTMTLIKQGGSVLTAGDDLRVFNAITGGSIDLTSSTSIRVGSLDASGAAINLTATNGDISGMRTGTWGALPTTSANTILSTDFDEADLVSAGTITVTANNGAIQLGSANAAGAITADAKAFVADTLTATGLTGLIDVNVTAGSLNVDTTSSTGTTSLIKTGAGGDIRFDSITGPGVTLNSSTDVIGTTITATGAFVSIDATRDISVDTINAGSVFALANRDGDFQTVTATGGAYLGAVRDLTLDSLTSTTSSVSTEAGRDLTVTTKIDGKTSASAFAAILDGAGLLDAVLITSDGTATARSGNDASVTTLSGTTGASVIVSGDYSGTSITSSAGAISFSTSGDVAIDTASAATGISGTVGSLHAISLTSAAGGVTLTASTGDIAGKFISGTQGALPTTTTGTSLSGDYGKLNVIAQGAVGLTAANGAMQLGTVTNGGDFTGSAKAITIDSATPGGLLSLTATSGTLYVGAAEAGLSLTLTKQGTDDELRFGTLESGNFVGGTSGGSTLTSSTDIRGTSITARGGSISVAAADGEVTGLAAGRLALSAQPDLDGLGDPVAGTDTGTITVTSGLLSKLGNVRAGSNIVITAGVSGSATLGGAIDVLDVTSAGGNIDLTSYNDGIATNGISYEDLSGQRIWVFAYGAASGDVDGLTATGANLYTYAESGGVTVTDHTSTGYVYLVAGGGDVDAGVVDAGNDVAYLFASNNAQATSVSSDTEVYLFADNNVDVGTATAGTSLIGSANNDFALQSGTGAAYVELTSGNDMQLGTLSSTAGNVVLNAGGDITGANGFTANAAQRPDITAATAIDIIATGSVELDTATATGSSLSVRAGTATIDGSVDINTATAGGAMQLVATATGTADDADHNGTVRVGTALAGTTLTLSNVLLGGTIGDVVVDTSATAGNGALLTATGNDARFDAADNARIESATALTGTIAVRAGDAIGASNLAQGADFNAGEDLALKSGNGINLGTATAGDDLILESTSTITVGDLTATGTNALLDNRTVSFASPTTIAIAGPETNLGASIVVRSSSGSVNSTGNLTANNGSVTIDSADEASVSGNVTAGINYTVTAVNGITLGGASDASQSAKGAVLIESTSGGVLADGTGALTLTANSDGLGTETLTITAPGDITINSATLIGGDGGKQSDVLLTSSGGEISVTGIDAARLLATAATGFTATAPISVGSAATGADAVGGPSTVDIKVTGGNIVADDITAAGAGHDIRLSASGTISTGALSAARSVIVNGVTTGSASGAFSADSLTSTSGPIDIKASTITVTGTTSSAGALTLETTGGDLALGDASSSGTMTLTSSGALTATSLTSTGAPINGTAASIDITTISAGGALTLETTGGTLALGDASSSGTMTLTSSGALTADSLTSTGGGITGTGASVDISGAVNAGGALALEATGGDLSIGSGSAAGTAALTASGTITTGAFSAGGNAVTLTAADAEITGAITGSTITVVNKAGADNAFRIGDNAEGTGGFELDTAEVNLLGAATVTLDAGTGTGLTAQDVQIGDLALTNATVQTLEINAMQRIDITGALTKGAGSGLTTLRLGGTATETDLATVLRLAALGDGTGGLIDVGDAALELRAAKIGAGQDAGFLDLVGIGANPVGTPLDARLMVSNPASSLYNATALGGTIYQPAAQVMIRANTMVVRYSDFALFQNTGLPGANEGVRLASALSPIAPALRIIGPASPVGGPFALFGEINGVRDTATALLGDAVINVLSVDRTSARINGCLIGSGAGCLTTLAISPILGTFDPVRGSIFFANTDFELPFDPLVGTNNDSLFGDVGTFGLEDVPLESIDCSDGKAGAECGKPNEDKK